MYEPAEDSFLLKEAIIEFCKNKKEINSKSSKLNFALDMGTGSGILAQELANHFEKVIAVDINEETIKQIKEENKLNKKIILIQSDLFENVPKQKFDLITFNPPYLPNEDGEEYEDEELTSGISGLNTTIEFLKQAKEFLNENGMILFIASSLAKINVLESEMKKLNYEFKQIKKQHIFFEDIIVYLVKTS